ncbi:hypothetical protein SAMD00019534_101330 [Acytostelium subglobosum LB1]|uniref:hypothetical protein n=1 Tax=Acytostelium subglobosum LB1 TaxID=1410327 RepID=UPI000644ABED|nr:hypothetical protein SAMD00019534_101330 [Acytostelium subglobosum LB1]GAM26958.1 hypothetical protein SAMD00019534_101330 [Acytostelium subglobosum LB1]|eukprot:XP_012750226.1 hypothetical protein SAMD00019534_101330 [Acytostelium subglobosum LB1]
MERVDRFNLATQKFENFGRMPFRPNANFMHFHNNSIIAVSNGRGSDIVTFNLQTQATVVIVNANDLGLYTEFGTSCFDGHDNLYFIVKKSPADRFYRYTLSTKSLTDLCQMYHLAPGPRGVNYLHLQSNCWSYVNDKIDNNGWDAALFSTTGQMSSAPRVLDL